MTLTSHAHHIPGSPPETGDVPPAARCGGPGLCGICTKQSDTWRQEAERIGILEELDAAAPQHQGILVAQIYQSKIVNIEAIQFTGGAANGMDIEAWVKAFGGNATWRNEMEPWQSEDGTVGHDGIPEMLTIQTLEGFMEAPPGWWIIRGTKGEFYPCRDDVFREKYEPLKFENKENNNG